MRRRDFIRYGIGIAGACACGVSNAFSLSSVRGCCLRNGALDGVIAENGAKTFSLSDPMISTSGDRKFDEALGRQLVKMASLFDVYPGFGYMQDASGENAFASPETHIANTQGTVLFGLNLLRKTLEMGDGGDCAVHWGRPGMAGRARVRRRDIPGKMRRMRLTVAGGYRAARNCAAWCTAPRALKYMIKTRERGGAKEMAIPDRPLIPRHFPIRRRRISGRPAVYRVFRLRLGRGLRQRLWPLGPPECCQPRSPRAHRTVIFYFYLVQSAGDFFEGKDLT